MNEAEEKDYKRTQGRFSGQWICLLFDCAHHHGCINISKFIKLCVLNMCILLDVDFLKVEKRSEKHFIMERLVSKWGEQEEDMTVSK